MTYWNYDAAPKCPDCGHVTVEHYRGNDYIGCHVPVFVPRVRSIFERERKKGLIPCPCRRLDFDDLPPRPPDSEQGSLW